jgi:hypothetical protein
MAQPYFLPRKDQTLASFSANLSALVTVNFAAYGLLVGDATTLANLQSVFVAKLAIALTPNTRTPTSIMAKETAKAQLRADIQAIVKRLQANLSITAEQKTALGITVPDHVRTPAAPPTTRPVLALSAIESRGLRLRLTDEATPTRRAKPPGTEGAEIYSFAAGPGVTPPGDLTGWSYQGLARKSDYQVSFDIADVGKTAWVRALWTSTRGGDGPVSEPITATIAA